MTRNFLYRRGDGNEGNFVRAHVTIEAGEDTFAVLRALLLNDFIPGHSHRRHIAKHVEIDGEEDGPWAMVYEGPRGEQAFDAAWLTAELQLVEPEYAAQQMPNARPWRELCDKGAIAAYNIHAGK